ncbi:MAG: chorismate mutase [Parerythrobacter sp.]
MSTRNDEISTPDECQTMRDVRRGVDAVDTALVDLLKIRFGYMRAAARIKTDRDTVRDEARKAAVVAAAVEQAKEAGLPEQAIAALWDGLVEASIAYETDEWDRFRG